MQRTRLIVGGAVGLALILVVMALGYGLLATRQAMGALQRLELPQAAASAEQALPIASSLNVITFRQIPDLRLWQTSLELISNLPQHLTALQAQTLDPTLAPTPPNLSVTLQQLQQDADQTWLLQYLFSTQLGAAQNALAQTQIIHDQLLTGRRQILIVLQNTHELRATGGFMGSYAIVTLNHGQLEHVEIQDIYVPDGQFIGFVTAPPGVQEYLSSGRGLRLPDANWWPDFPASAQQILTYFALGNESGLDGMVAVNLEVIEALLTVTGDVYVPDYQLTVTPENLADALRSQRDDFFPGSIAKQHILERVFNQVKFKLAELTPAQQRQLAQVIHQAIQHKQLQLYANDDQLQSLLNRYQASGQLDHQQADFYFLAVESNVGINKANRGVTRQLQLDLQPESSTITTTFTNTNLVPGIRRNATTRPDTSPHYANYQRWYVLPTASVTAIQIDNQPSPTWHEQIITTSTGQELKEIGVFIPVPAQSTVTAQLVLSHPPLPANPTLAIQKQSGLPDTLYRINLNQQTQEVVLNQDQVISF